MKERRPRKTDFSQQITIAIRLPDPSFLSLLTHKAMPESTTPPAVPEPNPTPTPVPAPSANNGEQAAVNQAQIAAAAKTLDLIGKVRRYATEFTAEEIDEPFLTELENQCAQFSSLVTRAQSGTIDKGAADEVENTAHLALVVAAQDVQSRARQKYAATAPDRLSSYHVNHGLSAAAYDLFIQFVQDMINLLTGDSETPADTLPGMTPERLAKLVQLRKDYIAAVNAQSATQKTASQARLERNALITSITAERLKIQFVADRLHPYQLAESAAFRREFFLTENRPFVG